MRMMTHLSGESMRSSVARKDLAAGLGMDLYTALSQAGLDRRIFIVVNIEQFKQARRSEHAAHFGHEADQLQLAGIAHGGYIDADEHANAGAIQIGYAAKIQHQTVLLVEQILQIQMQLSGLFAK